MEIQYQLKYRGVTYSFVTKEHLKHALVEDSERVMLHLSVASYTESEFIKERFVGFNYANKIVKMLGITPEHYLTKISDDVKLHLVKLFR